MIRQSLEGLAHTHRWQEHPVVQLLECLLCGAWRLQERMPGESWEVNPLPQTGALLDQLAQALLLTTQLLERHQLTAQEATQCMNNRALLAQIAQSLQTTPLATSRVGSKCLVLLAEGDRPPVSRAAGAAGPADSTLDNQGECGREEGAGEVVGGGWYKVVSFLLYRGRVSGQTPSTTSSAMHQQVSL